MEIIKGKIKSAKKVVIYGPEGIGKSTMASMFPDPLFSDTEGSTKELNIARFQAPSSWTMLIEQVKYVKEHPDCCKTYVVDTADWGEKLCAEHVCVVAHKNGIEDFGYGKGYTYLKEEFGKWLNLLDDLIDRGINVVITAHAMMRKFEQPDEMGAYDRWELKLSRQTAPLLKEWADMLLFANYKIYSVAQDDSKKRKAQGGRRVMYATHHACWDAKNRYGLPDEMDFDYSNIAHLFIDNEPKQGDQQPRQAKEEGMKVPENITNANEPAIERSTMPSKQEEMREEPVQQSLNEQIPPDDITPFEALNDLMRAYFVGENEIRAVVAHKGYYPIDTPIDHYDEDFVRGVLVAAWHQVFEAIQNDIRHETETIEDSPF